MCSDDIMVASCVPPLPHFSSRWFRETSTILFLNKRDLFAEKIQKVPITVCPEFAEYDGPNTYNECSAFIQEKFEVWFLFSILLVFLFTVTMVAICGRASP
jgi:hypothetical protein